MKNSFFMISGSLMAQPEMPRPEGGAGPSNQGLTSYTLPSSPIRESDMPRIIKVTEQVLGEISESVMPARGDGRSDLETVKSGILTFMDWLNRQECIVRATTPFDVEATDTYAGSIFTVYPGQLLVDIVFDMGGDSKRQHRLMIFVSRVDQFRFGCLVENKSIAGVSVPEPWPSGYLEMQP